MNSLKIYDHVRSAIDQFWNGIQLFLWHSTQQFQFMKYCYYYLREACLMAVKMRCYQHVSRHHIIIWRLPNWTRRQTWTISSRDIHFVVMDCKLWSEISISFELNAQTHPIISECSLFEIFIEKKNLGQNYYILTPRSFYCSE